MRWAVLTSLLALGACKSAGDFEVVWDTSECPAGSSARVSVIDSFDGDSLTFEGACSDGRFAVVDVIVPGSFQIAIEITDDAGALVGVEVCEPFETCQDQVCGNDNNCLASNVQASQEVVMTLAFPPPPPDPPEE